LLGKGAVEKKECFKASWAEILFFGSNTSIFDKRSRAKDDAPGPSKLLGLPGSIGKICRQGCGCL